MHDEQKGVFSMHERKSNSMSEPKCLVCEFCTHYVECREDETIRICHFDINCNDCPFVYHERCAGFEPIDC